jgi:hypothetical protein
MAIFDIISIGVSSIIMVILSKSRLHFENDCCSCSYNEHRIDLSKLQEEKENDDEGYDDLPVDSFKTLPLPVYHQKPLGTIDNLRTLNK